jgi:hypothetical protein
MIRRALGLALAGLLAGCSFGSIGKLPDVSDPVHAATIILVRPYHFVGSLSTITITLNRTEIAEIGTGEHIIVTLVEGEHIVGLKTWNPALFPFARSYPTQVLQAERGRIYYLRVGPPLDAINRIDEAEGRGHVAKTTLLAPRSRP